MLLILILGYLSLCQSAEVILRSTSSTIPNSRHGGPRRNPTANHLATYKHFRVLENLFMEDQISKQVRTAALTVPSIPLSRTLSITMLGGELAVQLNWNHTSLDTLNINEYARFFRDPQCSTNLGRRVLTTVVTLTEDANLMPQWVSGGKRIVVAVLDETRRSCGRQPLPDKCQANQNAPGCVSSLCSSDMDCEGTLLCGRSGRCERDTDIELIEVNEITVRRTNGQNIVTFIGSTIPRSALETIFVDEGTESISVAESDLTLDQALNRRSACQVTWPTWRRFGLGVRCNLGVRWDGQFNVGRNFTNAAEGLELRVGAEIQMSGGFDTSLDLHSREGGEVGFSVDPLAFRFKFSLEGQASFRNPGNGRAFTGLDLTFPTPLGTSLRVLGQEITLGVTIEFKMAPSIRGKLTYEMGVTFPGVNARARTSGLSFRRVGPDTSFTQNLQASVALEQRTDIAIKCGIRTRVLGSRLRSELALQTGVLLEVGSVSSCPQDRPVGAGISWGYYGGMEFEVAFARWNADTGITFFGEKDEYPYPIAGVCLSFVPGDRGIPVGPLIPDGRQDAENYICPSYRNSVFNKAVPATQRPSYRACHNALPGDKAVEVLQLRSTRYVYPPGSLRRTKNNDGLYFVENIGNILCNMDTQSCRLNTRVCTLGGCNSPTGTRLSGRITKAEFNTRDRSDMKVVLDTMKIAIWNSTNYIWTTCGVTRASPPSNSWIGDYGLTIQSGTFQVRLWRCPSPSNPTQPLLAEMIVSVQSEFDEAQVPRSGTVCSLNVTPIPSTAFNLGYALSGGQCRL